MTQLLFPMVWVVILAGQIVWWSRSSRPGVLDRLTIRRVVALRGALGTPDPWVVAAVVAAILLPTGAALCVEGAVICIAYLAVAAVLVTKIVLTRVSAQRMLTALGNRGVVDLGPDIARTERLRRRWGLVTLVSIALAVLPFRAWEDAPGDVTVVGGLVVFAVSMLVFFVAIVLWFVNANRVYEARRRATAAMDPRAT